MRKLVVLVAIGVSIQGGLLAGGCSEMSQPAGDKDPALRGSLRMQLTATSDSGKVYRLRQATMPVTSFFGGGGITLNSETDPTKQVLEAFLNPGSYQIQLVDGWFIEQVDELLGTAIPVSATLLSSSFQFFDIFSNQETFVRFDFEVDGSRVTFGPPGRLIVGIGVHERNGNAFCGNGIREDGEACDGADLGFETCSSITLGTLPNGFLLCSPFCSFDISFCSGGEGGVGGAGGSFGGFGGTFDGGLGGFGGTFGGDASAGAPPIDGGPSPNTGGAPSSVDGGSTTAGGATAAGGSSTGGGSGRGNGGRG